MFIQQHGTKWMSRDTPISQPSEAFWFGNVNCKNLISTFSLRFASITYSRINLKLHCQFRVVKWNLADTAKEREAADENWKTQWKSKDSKERQLIWIWMWTHEAMWWRHTFSAFDGLRLNRRHCRHNFDTAAAVEGSLLKFKLIHKLINLRICIHVWSARNGINFDDYVTERPNDAKTFARNQSETNVLFNWELMAR